MSAAGRPLRRVRIPEEVRPLLERKGITVCQDVLQRSLVEFLDMGLPLEQARLTLKAVAEAVCPKPVSARRLAELRKQVLPTSLPALDSLLRGGIPSATVTELVGPAGSGKTQFCTMLAMLTALPKDLGGLGAGAIYIDTEGAFSSERLVGMAQARFPDYFADEQHLISLCERIHVLKVDTSAGLLSALRALEDQILDSAVKLIALDSAASLLRKEFQGQSRERADLLGQEASLLKYYAETFDLQVVVTNQVTTRFDDGSGGDSFVTAALGNTWAHSVNTRITLNYLPSGQTRFVNIVKSPLVAGGKVVYAITDKGLSEMKTPEGEVLPDAGVAATSTHISARNTGGQAFASAHAQHNIVLQAQRRSFYTA